MVTDLLHAVGRGDWLEDMDFGTLEPLSAEHVGDLGQTRRGDAPWTAALEMRDLIAPVYPTLLPYQPSQRLSLARGSPLALPG